MSFEIECSGCGALSSPSIGACPYCKAIIAPSKKIQKELPQVNSVKEYYTKGNLPSALFLAKKLWDEVPKVKKSPTFLNLFSKILFESEAHPSILNSVIAHGLFLNKQMPELAELREVIQAKPFLEIGKNDAGEVKLREILKRNSKSAYAHFILGTHLYYVENDQRQAILHLENCVRSHPNFLRAWGCLGIIYKKIGNEQLASRAFKQVIKLETDPKMKKYFRSQL